MSLPCSDQSIGPKKMKSVSLPRGVEAVRCWCGDLCKVKEVTDFSDWLGMKFFMCANYESDPPESISAYVRPPVCSSHPDYCLLESDPSFSLLLLSACTIVGLTRKCRTGR